MLRPSDNTQKTSAGMPRYLHGEVMETDLAPSTLRPRDPALNVRLVNVGELVTSSSEQDILISYSLGSCLGLAIYDPETRIGGMLHAMLPLSSLYAGRAVDNAAMFVDSGALELFKQLMDMGLSRNRAVVKIAGCAQILGNSEHFRIGERNLAVIRRILWKNGILLKSADVGGSLTRSIRLDLATGRFLIKVMDRIVEM